MSAAEIIEQIKALPTSEQREVAAFVQTLETPAGPSAGEKVRYASTGRVGEIADLIFAQNESLFRKLAE